MKLEEQYPDFMLSMRLEELELKEDGSEEGESYLKDVEEVGFKELVTGYSAKTREGRA